MGTVPALHIIFLHISLMLLRLQGPRSIKVTIYLNNGYYNALGLLRKNTECFDNLADTYLSYAISNQNYDDVNTSRSLPGLTIAVCSQGSVASMHFSSANTLPVSPGTDTNIRVSATIRQRLPVPFTDCTDQHYLDEDQSIRYSVEACISLCYQKQVKLCTPSIPTECRWPLN